MNENSSIDLSRIKERSVFRSFVDRHEERVRNTCFRFLNDREDAEEVAQDVFVEVYRSVDRFRGESDIATWVYRIAVTRSIDFLRKKKRHKRFGLVKKMLGLAEVENELAAPEHNNPDRALELKQRNEVLRQAVDSLPENQRTAIILIKYEEYSYKEVSEIMGLSVPSIEALVHRAKENLQKKLSLHYEQVS